MPVGGSSLRPSRTRSHSRRLIGKPTSNGHARSKWPGEVGPGGLGANMKTNLKRTRTLLFFYWLSLAAPDLPAEPLALHVRSQIETAKGSGQWRTVENTVQWEPRKTAIVVCDMWNQHWCKGATARVAEMAPRMNEVLQAARRRGVFIIHCPSDTLKYYEGTPQRQLAQAAPKTTPRVPIQGWCALDAGREAPLPIDDSDGGCDDEPQCKQGGPWTHQIDALQILEGDAITDSAEAYYLMEQRGIENVI